MPTNQPTAAIRVAHGAVVNVRSIPTRQITRIEIEIPIEDHVEATRILFGQDVLVMPAAVKGLPYGMADGSPEGLGVANAQSPTQPQPAATPPCAPGLRRASGGLGPRLNDRAVDILKWLGARCREDHFQDWLRVRTEAAAIQRVRELCDVQSRSDIPHSAAAREAFFDKIFTPYRAAQTPQDHGSSHDH